MIYYEQMRARPAPTGIAKLLFLNLPLLLLVMGAAFVGFAMLYSVAGGDLDPWARPQMVRFGIGMLAMFLIALVPLGFWRWLSPAAYLLGIALLIAVDQVGTTNMGAQRWIDLGFIQLQPSEAMKVALVMALAQYYAWLEPEKVSRPIWVILPLLLIALPTFMVLQQPDLGTSLLLAAGGGVVMFLAGVSWWYFGFAISSGIGVVSMVMVSRGTSWQILEDYQYRRIETFLDPASDPLGSGYHITQSKIALGSGGLSGRGLTQGTQSRLNFLPEKHTDFIFTTLAEELGLIGGLGLLTIYALIVVFGMASAFSNTDRYGALLTGGLTAAFFFYFVVNMAMVMGMAPVVGVPLPLVSYGGSAMLVLLGAFGLIQCAHIHKPRTGVL